jgi:glycine C-acetyltransferase
MRIKGRWESGLRKLKVILFFQNWKDPISNRMKFKGKEVITWSVNDYLGLANLPEIRKVDAEAAADYGSAYPMGARMMSGHTELHEQLENELADFVDKEAAYLLNFGYQGILSTGGYPSR